MLGLARVTRCHAGVRAAAGNKVYITTGRSEWSNEQTSFASFAELPTKWNFAFAHRPPPELAARERVRHDAAGASRQVGARHPWHGLARLLSAVELSNRDSPPCTLDPTDAGVDPESAARAWYAHARTAECGDDLRKAARWDCATTHILSAPPPAPSSRARIARAQQDCVGKALGQPPGPQPGASRAWSATVEAVWRRARRAR